jgi:hypothetical protein
LIGLEKAPQEEWSIFNRAFIVTVMKSLAIGDAAVVALCCILLIFET